jgi:hypothetical protein
MTTFCGVGVGGGGRGGRLPILRKLCAVEEKCGGHVRSSNERRRKRAYLSGDESSGVVETDRVPSKLSHLYDVINRTANARCASATATTTLPLEHHSKLRILTVCPVVVDENRTSPLSFAVHSSSINYCFPSGHDSAFQGGGVRCWMPMTTNLLTC